MKTRTSAKLTLKKETLRVLTAKGQEQQKGPTATCACTGTC